MQSKVREQPSSLQFHQTGSANWERNSRLFLCVKLAPWKLMIRLWNRMFLCLIPSNLILWSLMLWCLIYCEIECWEIECCEARCSDVRPTDSGNLLAFLVKSLKLSTSFWTAHRIDHRSHGSSYNMKSEVFSEKIETFNLRGLQAARNEDLNSVWENNRMLLF